eukprot:EG_transcript_1632
MGLEKLHEGFRAAFAGGTPLGKLPELFQTAGLSVTLQQVETAVATLGLEADGTMTYQQCQEVFLHLQAVPQRPEDQIQEVAKEGRLTHWLVGRSDSDSTNLLLLVVVSLCCLSAFLAGGLAILLLVLDDTTTMHRYLQESLDVVQDTLEVYATQIAVQQEDQQQLTLITTLASMLKYVAFSTMVESNQQQLLRVATSVANTLGAWWSSLPEQSFLHYAAVAALLANRSAGQYGRPTTATLFDEVNAKMPAGFELLLGQRRSNASAAVQFLTRFRFADQCSPGGCATDGPAAAPMAAALAGATAASAATDYRGTPVFTGYTGVQGLGVQLNLDHWSMVESRFGELQAHLQAWSADATSWEYLLGYMPAPGIREMIYAPPTCDDVCSTQLLAEGMPMYRALSGETGVMADTDTLGVPTVTAFAMLPNTAVGLVVRMRFSDIVAATLKSLTALVDTLNSKHPWGTEEFELLSFSVQGNSTNFTHLSSFRYGSQCPAGGCTVATPYAQAAAQNCSTGVMRTTDYRGQPVVVGYTCLPEVNAVLSVKLDFSSLDAETLAAVVSAVDGRTAQDTATSAQFLVAAPTAGRAAAQVRGYGDFNILSKLKYPASCAKPNCSWNRESALRALQDLKDVIDTTDYRDTAVLAAASRSTAVSTGIGLAVELDRSEALRPMLATVLKVGFFTVGIVAGCTVALVLVAKLLLRSMITAKEEGKKVVGEEKERFSKLVASMYPAFVVPRLLEGDKQLVCEVPGAAVFFSDIHEFTSASNTMGSEELLCLMGYVYGVMDCVADRFGVYKVKTIGDAYLAVRGLPGSDSENPSYELLRFASCVCQVFGDRFVHPAEGHVLAVMNSAMHWNASPSGKRRGKTGSKVRDADGAESVAPSLAPSSHRGKHRGSRASAAASEAAGAARADGKVQCVMSYGLAAGPLVAGVLAGRC